MTASTRRQLPGPSSQQQQAATRATTLTHARSPAPPSLYDQLTSLHSWSDVVGFAHTSSGRTLLVGSAIALVTTSTLLYTYYTNKRRRRKRPPRDKAIKPKRSAENQHLAKLQQSTHHTAEDESHYLDSDDFPLTGVHIKPSQSQHALSASTSLQSFNDHTQQPHNDSFSNTIATLPPAEQSLIQQCMAATEALIDTADVGDDAVKQLSEQIIHAAASSQSLQFYTRIRLAEFLLQYESYVEAAALDSEANADNVHVQIRPSKPSDSRQTLTAVIKLLTPPATAVNQQMLSREADTLLLDVYLRQHDYSALHTTYKRIQQHNDDLLGTSLKEELMLLTTSVYIGQLEAFNQYAEHYISHSDSLAEFHAASEQSVTGKIPDYSALHVLVQQLLPPQRRWSIASTDADSSAYSTSHHQHTDAYSTKSTVTDSKDQSIITALAQPTSWRYTTYQLTRYAVKLQHIDCSDQQRLTKLQTLLRAQLQGSDYQEHECDADDIVRQSGCLLALRSKAASSYAYHLHGWLSEDQLECLGYVEKYADSNVTSSSLQEVILKQSEEIHVKRVDQLANSTSSEWQGTYVLTNEAFDESTLAAVQAPVKLTYHLIMQMHEIKP